MSTEAFERNVERMTGADAEECAEGHTLPPSLSPDECPKCEEWEAENE